MDPRTARRGAFEPVSRAFSDTWLQVRAKPVLYLLIWGTLSLAPYLILGLAFSGVISRAMNEFFDASQELISSGDLQQGMTPEMIGSFFRLLGYYGIIWIIVSLTTVYYGAVLSGTVGRFRQRVFPRFSEAMSDGADRYIGFLKAVLVAVWKIFWKPVVALSLGTLLGTVLRQTMFSSVGFFIAVILAFSGLYRFGLGPFIHLSLGIRGQEACLVSREFYVRNRPVVSSLFLAVVFLPILLMLLLFSLFMNLGIYFGAGSIILWLIQSLVQFTVTMVMVNFAMNTFNIVEEDPAPEAGAE